jgi:phosphate-selective porin OprO/OprP
VYGPFSLQGEYMYSDVDSAWTFGDLDFDGWYAYASWILTGEHRPYSTDSGTFGKIKPKNPWNLEKGHWGAWELAARYSTLDLNSGWAIRGGEETNITVGLNWYLNTNTRIMFNYVLADIDHDLYEDDINVFQTRFQFFF